MALKNNFRELRLVENLQNKNKSFVISNQTDLEELKLRIRTTALSIPTAVFETVSRIYKYLQNKTLFSIASIRFLKYLT